MAGFRAMVGRASTRTLGTGASHDIIDVHWQAPATLFFGAIGTKETFEKLQAFASSCAAMWLASSPFPRDLLMVPTGIRPSRGLLQR